MSAAVSPSNPHDFRILFLTTSFPNFMGHGSGAIVHQQARGLARIGHRVTVLCPSGPGLAPEENMDGVRVVRYRYAPDKTQRIAYGGGIPANLAATPWLWGLVPSFMLSFVHRVHDLAADADLVHAHWTPAGVAGLIGGRGLPLVQTFHGSDLRMKTGMTRRLAEYVSRRAAAVVVPGDNMGRLARELGIGDDRLNVIHHGIDLSSIPSLPEASPPEIIYLGRLSVEKGPELLLRALARLPRGVARLIFVGEGPLKSELLAEVEKLELGAEVEFTGALPHSEALARLARASVFAMPSRREGFPVACLEAMAAGRPIVAAACGGPEDMIDHEKTGLLTPVENFDSLADALQRLLTDRLFAQALGRAARLRAESDFTRDTMIGKMDSLYRKLLR